MGGESSSDVARAAAALLRETDAIDRGIAMFVLVSGVAYLAVASVAMVLFYRERNAFEIRVRSAYLSLANGLCYMALLTAIVVRQLPGTALLHVDVDIYAIFTVYFFLSVCSTCTYGSRTIRLAMLYSPKARKAAPWLIPERNHVIACLLLGAASTAVPLYDMARVSDGSLRELEYYVLVTKHYWIVLFASQAVLLLLNPIAWFIDDLFGIGPELRAIMIVQLVTLLTGRLAEEYAVPDLLRWINSQKLGFVGAVIMISISIISPISRRLLHPLQSSDPKVLKAQARRRALGAQKGTSGGPFVSGGTLANDNDDAYYFSWRIASSAATHPSSASSSPGSWTYERVMSIPEVSAVFEAFSRKALCQESVLFLKDVTTFQAHGIGEVEAGLAADRKEGADETGGGINCDKDSEGRHSGNGAEGNQEELMLFGKIVHEYIVDGAPNEVNISGKDKSDILDVYNSKRMGRLGFNDLPASERRLVFARAFAEVRFMLESNLMRKFTSTDEFDRALAASRRRKRTSNG